MKQATRKLELAMNEECISKSVSMRPKLWQAVEKKVLSQDPELDFSKYVRRLIRRDLEAA